jgi:hypothetical protein
MPNKNGLILMTPTSVDKTGTGSTATVSANGSVEFSSCATLSLNGVFSTDYDNYMIVLRGDCSSAANVGYRLRVGGTDNSTASSYVYQELEAASTTVGGARITDNIGRFCPFNNTQENGAIVHIYGPFLAQPTAWRSVTANDASSARIDDYAGTHNQSTSYDGFTMIPGTGSITGRVAVYGMRK